MKIAVTVVGIGSSVNAARLAQLRDRVAREARPLTAQRDETGTPSPGTRGGDLSGVRRRESGTQREPLAATRGKP